MPLLFIIFVVISIAAIVFLSRQSFALSKTKEQFLKELARQVKGKLELLEGQVNSYRLTFNFEGFDFVYDDVELAGFQNKIEKGFLRLQMKNKYTLIFTELERSAGIRGDISAPVKVNEGSLTQMMKVYLPRNFSDLNVRTNDPYVANKIFEDPKILPVLSAYRNVDTRGYSSMALRIVDGAIILEFSTIPGVNPNLKSLRTNFGAFEGYLDEFILIAKKLIKLGYV